jgi:hypothetical protein
MLLQMRKPTKAVLIAMALMPTLPATIVTLIIQLGVYLETALNQYVLPPFICFDLIEFRLRGLNIGGLVELYAILKSCKSITC